nr:CHAP domain-containing protein [Streptococcus equi]
MEHVLTSMHFFCSIPTAFLNGFSLPRGYGNVESWGRIAKHQGYHVDHTPRVGAVAWWDKGFNQSHAYMDTSPG